MAWDSWESQLQEARAIVAAELGYVPGVVLDAPYGAVEILLPGGRRCLRGCLRSGLWRLVEDEVALSDEKPLAELLVGLEQGVHV